MPRFAVYREFLCADRSTVVTLYMVPEGDPRLTIYNPDVDCEEVTIVEAPSYEDAKRRLPELLCRCCKQLRSTCSREIMSAMIEELDAWRADALEPATTPELEPLEPMTVEEIDQLYAKVFGTGARRDG